MINARTSREEQKSQSEENLTRSTEEANSDTKHNAKRHEMEQCK